MKVIQYFIFSLGFGVVFLLIPCSLIWKCFFSVGVISIFILCIQKKRSQESFPFLRKISRQFKFKSHLLCQASDISLGDIPLLKKSETKHIIISGATGTGKTNCLRHLLYQIKSRGDQAFILDSSMDLVEEFYQEEQDILLNPYDKRSFSWNPWHECIEEYHYAQLIDLLFMQEVHEEEEALFLEAKEYALYTFLHHQKSYQQNPKTWIKELSRSENPFIHSLHNLLKLLPTGHKNASIRDWILRPENPEQLFFLGATAEQKFSLFPLISCWFSLAISIMQARSQKDHTKKIWFLIDDLPSWKKLIHLENAFSQIRKYGGCMVIVVQNWGQLELIYGTCESQSILDQCNIKICFRQGDHNVAKQVARFFTKFEEEDPLVTPCEVLELQDLEAFLQIPGCSLPTYTKFKHCRKKFIAEKYAPKKTRTYLSEH